MESSGLGVGVRLISKAELTSTWEFEEPLYPSLQRLQLRDMPRELVRVTAPASLVEPLHVYLHAALSKEKDSSGKWRALFMRYYQSERKLWDSAFLRFQPEYRLKQIEGFFHKLKRGNVAKKPVVRVTTVVALQRASGFGSRDCHPGTEVERSGEQSAGGSANAERLSAEHAGAVVVEGERAGSLEGRGSAEARANEGVWPQKSGEKALVVATEEQGAGRAGKSGSGGCNSAAASASSCEAASGINGGRMAVQEVSKMSQQKVEASPCGC